MGVTEKIDQSRMMGTAAFKKEINHLLYSNSFTGSDGEFDAGWNSRDHALVNQLDRPDVHPARRLRAQQQLEARSRELAGDDNLLLIAPRKALGL